MARTRRSRNDQDWALVDHLYESAGDAAGWRQTVEALVSRFDGAAGALYAIDLDWCRRGCPDPGSASAARVSFGFDPALERAYFEHYIQRIPWYQEDGPHLWPGEVFLSQAVVPDRALESSEFHAGLLRIQDLHYNVTAVLRRRGTEVFCITIQRGHKRRGAYGDRSVEQLGRLVPHLRRAILLHEQLVALRVQQEQLLLAIEHVGASVALVDAGGHLLTASPRARALLQSGDVLQLDRQGGLRAAVARATDELRRAIRAARQPAMGPSVVRLPRKDAGPPVEVRVLPVTARETSPGARLPAAMLLLPEPAQPPSIDEEALRRSWDLTAGEARVGALLLEGLTPRQMAERQGKSLNTVKTHLKRLFAKTGVSRQAEFVRIVLQRSLTD